MPLYVYRCSADDCNVTTEIRRSIEDMDLPVYHVLPDGHGRVDMKRVLDGRIGISGGFYEDEYGSGYSSYRGS